MKEITIITSGMINILQTEINRLKKLLHSLNATLKLIQAIPRQINLKRKGLLISACILQEVLVLKELIVGFIIEHLRKKILRDQMKTILEMFLEELAMQLIRRIILVSVHLIRNVEL